MILRKFRVWEINFDFQGSSTLSTLKQKPNLKSLSLRAQRGNLVADRSTIVHWRRGCLVLPPRNDRFIFRRSFCF